MSVAPDRVAAAHELVAEARHRLAPDDTAAEALDRAATLLSLGLIDSALTDLRVAVAALPGDPDRCALVEQARDVLGGDS